VAVKVRSTEDWLGADHVYARLTGDKKHRTEVKRLNDGDSHDFLVRLDAVAEKLPLSGPVRIDVFDKDTPDADDKIVSMEWDAPYRPVTNKASMDGADYHVRVGYER
jgi:hypothetical protein